MEQAVRVLKVAIAGCTGRMGERLVALTRADPALHFVGGVRTLAGRDTMVTSTAEQHPGGSKKANGEAVRTGISQEPGTPGKDDAPGVYTSLDELIDESGHKPSVVIDFSNPAGTMSLIPSCIRHGVALVIGTTGFTPAELEKVESAARDIPLCIAANFSLGVNLLIRIVGEVAASLGEDFDIELVEAHHNRKVDAPSGTAVALLDSIATATGRRTCTGSDEEETTSETHPEKMVLVHGRESRNAKRRRGEVGVHALRMGSVVGEHSVMYASDFERITLSHHAETRDVFASGAIRMAKWIAHRPKGKYQVSDMLFEKRKTSRTEV
ncbi:dihydrodipicolinate reductase [Toxoplasma gondii TgCatPRC2]|uniref:4-hydroxy-tetrahydrodipicolinate reductase n=3 Tax=Toxoplasma gondii TaxID=5811 RepID=A0A151HRQ2_TOXGO|nr:dihydrodipicolinate reductase [Toxoplasma gondii ME49]EPT30496.1 dihydrodipicolinate reductase [Toxoplasma gondii ME49]KYF41017.1 dihydrodipicolinate reductase [Toxoplasma gondii ARI]KYK72095.1 dihydrodipicolinate reductase [Toxoplasma gondii TgCatPRC2]|eukprot:XP_002366867.1 dihydrodipicolinate reductase [Toxoplasma gondii ME49]